MSKTKSRIPHLFQRWKQIAKHIRTADDIRLFLDFDGTLVPICPTPKEVKLPATVRRILARLNRHPRVHVALVSGRRNVTLRKYVRIPRIQILGLYGWERNGKFVLPVRTRKALPHLRLILKSLPAKFSGISFEEKGVSFAIHFRGASPTAIHSAQSWTRKLLVRIRSDFRVIKSHSTWEIVPRHVKGKGSALREIAKGLKRKFLPIYLGDDLTDEPAFRALGRGIMIRVGPTSPTSAHFRLSDPDEVRVFLERLEKELR